MRAEWRARVRLDADLLRRARSRPPDAHDAQPYLAYVLEASRHDRRRSWTPWTSGAVATTSRSALDGAGAGRRARADAGAGLRLRTAYLQLQRTIKRISSGSIARLVDFVLDSQEKRREAAAAIFARALARAGVTAGEAAYVGDLTPSTSSARAASA